MYLSYFSFVVHVLIALKHPSDDEKMQIAQEELEKQQSERYRKKHDNVPPLEWLHPKKERDIESIDCLLHHGDLLKGANICPDSDKRVESIETCLFEKRITQWDGTVSEICSGREGTIIFNKHFSVRFVPSNAQPSMPSTGDRVNFCLSFDMFGLSAWRVMRVLETKYNDLFNSEDEDSSSEYSEQDDLQDKYFYSDPSPSSIGTSQADKNQKWNGCESQKPQDEGIIEKRCYWDKYSEQPMKGNISFTNSVVDYFFEGSFAKDKLLNLKVVTSSEQTRATNVRVLKVRK